MMKIRRQPLLRSVFLIALALMLLCATNAYAQDAFPGIPAQPPALSVPAPGIARSISVSSGVDLQIETSCDTSSVKATWKFTPIQSLVDALGLGSVDQSLKYRVIDFATGATVIAHDWSSGISSVFPSGGTLDPLTSGISPDRIYLARISYDSYDNNYYGKPLIWHAAAEVTFQTKCVQLLPKGIAVNQKTHRVYITDISNDPGSGRVVVADPPLNFLPLSNPLLFVKTIPVGKHPWGIAVDEVSNKIYVANNQDNPPTVSVIDGATHNVATITLPLGIGAPSYVAVVTTTNPHWVYVPMINSGNGNLVVINGTTNSYTVLPLGANLFGVTADNPNRRAYVSSRDGKRLFIVDAPMTPSGTIYTGNYVPYALALDSSVNRLYASMDQFPPRGPSSVWRWNLPSTVPIMPLLPVNSGGEDNGGQGITANIATHYIFVTNPASNSVCAFDGTSSAPIVYKITASYDNKPFNLPVTVATDYALNYTYIGSRAIPSDLNGAIGVINNRTITSAPVCP